MGFLSDTSSSLLDPLHAKNYRNKSGLRDIHAPATVTTDVYAMTHNVA